MFFQWLQEIGRPVLYKERQAGSKARQERKAGWMVFTSDEEGGRRQEAAAAGAEILLWPGITMRGQCTFSSCKT